MVLETRDNEDSATIFGFRTFQQKNFRNRPNLEIWEFKTTVYRVQYHVQCYLELHLEYHVELYSRRMLLRITLRIDST